MTLHIPPPPPILLIQVADLDACIVPGESRHHNQERAIRVSGKHLTSFRRPIIIMLTVPLAIIGAALGLSAGKTFLSFTAILGIYSLVGIIVNNEIVLIDRIDSERNQGKRLHEAITDACLARMHPILMTTLTTILGLIPLVLLGGAMWYPMAVPIIGGLAVGSVLTLGVVPVLYSLFFQG